MLISRSIILVVNEADKTLGKEIAPGAEADNAQMRKSDMVVYRISPSMSDRVGRFGTKQMNAGSKGSNLSWQSS